jgi:DNA-binding transcriptional ArsR family regulator
MSVAALEVIDDAARAVSVLNPIRRRLLTELIVPDSAAGLARRLNLGRQAVTYHVRQLQEDGLVRVVEERRRRNCVERVVQATARSYVISSAALGSLGADPEQIRDRFSSTYLIAVAARTIREVGNLRRLAEESEQGLDTLTLQTEVRFTTAADQQAFATELANALASLAMKYHRDHAPDGPRFSVTIMGHPSVHASPAPVIAKGRSHAVPALR